VSKSWKAYKRDQLQMVKCGSEKQIIARDSPLGLFVSVQ